MKFRWIFNYNCQEAIDELVWAGGLSVIYAINPLRLQPFIPPSPANLLQYFEDSALSRTWIFMELPPIDSKFNLPSIWVPFIMVFWDYKTVVFLLLDLGRIEQSALGKFEWPEGLERNDIVDMI